MGSIHPSPEAVRLLLIDDDVSAIKAMSKVLEQYPEQSFATSAAQGLSQLRSQAADLILVDADMPGMSGFDFCRVLKRDAALAQIPVIIATAHTEPGIELSALECGADDFVSKPLQPVQLRARIRAQLRRRRAQSEGDAGTMTVAGHRSILVVDDDLAMIRILRGLLEPLGEVHFATRGADALRRAAEIPFDLILLDAEMPAMSGFETCASLKADPRLRHIPVVFVTQFADPESETRALDQGAADFIAKPINPPVLRARLRNLLELKARNDEALVAARQNWRMVSDMRVAEMVREVGDGILGVNAIGRVVLANPAACELLEHSHESLIGRPFSELIPAAIPAATREPIAVEWAAGDGSSRHVEITGSISGEGDDALLTVVIRDLSPRDHLQAEADRRIRAEERGRTRSLMLSYLAHEMGNPLNGILGLGRLMARDPVAPLEGEQARRLALISSCAEQIKRLMQDLLDLGRIETGRFAIALDFIDPWACVAEAAGAVEAQAEQAQVTLETHPPALRVMVKADARRLTQVLTNVLSNAVKYNRPGGHVRVEAGQGPGVAIAVIDDGIGMSDSQLAGLFEPFNRAGRESGSKPGSGLGLALSRELMQAMGGRLIVSSAIEQGSSFRIELAPAEQGSA